MNAQNTQILNYKFDVISCLTCGFPRDLMTLQRPKIKLE